MSVGWRGFWRHRFDWLSKYRTIWGSSQNVAALSDCIWHAFYIRLTVWHAQLALDIIHMQISKSNWGMPNKSEISISNSLHRIEIVKAVLIPAESNWHISSGSQFSCTFSFIDTFECHNELRVLKDSSNLHCESRAGAMWVLHTFCMKRISGTQFVDTAPWWNWQLKDICNWRGMVRFESSWSHKLWRDSVWDSLLPVWAVAYWSLDGVCEPLEHDLCDAGHRSHYRQNLTSAPQISLGKLTSCDRCTAHTYYTWISPNEGKIDDFHVTYPSLSAIGDVHC